MTIHPSITASPDAAVLTNDQTLAANAFLKFLFSDSKIFVISGSAGVGKTFLMGYLSNKIMRAYEDGCKIRDTPQIYQYVTFTATTNKAAEVLERTLGKPVSTIHSFLGLKVDGNYRTGKTDLVITGAHKIRSNLIVFIDECSMIDTDLLEYIMRSFTDSKIVFVGDHAQMAPINEKLSPIYDNLDPKNLVVLTQPVRNADTPALVDLCTQLRETVETGIFRPIKEVPGIIDYLTSWDMPAALMYEFQDLDTSCRVLAYTNSRVQSYNEYIREDVRHQPPDFQVNDIVVVAQAYVSGQTTLSVERELVIARIGHIPEEETYSSYGSTVEYHRIDLASPTGSVVAFDVRLAVDRDLVKRITAAAAKKKDWGTYFALKNSYVDIRDKAACTIYKAQGSTYESVFVDLGNIGTSYDPEQVARLLFVAVSRARSRVYLYGELPGKYRDSKGKQLWVPTPMSDS